MRVEARGIVAVHPEAAHVHAVALQMGCVLVPLARASVLGAEHLRVRLVWRNRRRDITQVLTITMAAPSTPTQ